METGNSNLQENTNQQSIPLKRNRFSLIFGMIAVVAVFVFALSAPSDFPENETVFTVTPGQSLKSVGTELSNKRYIRSRVFFSTLVTFYGKDMKLPPGDYFFDRPISVFAVARRIAFGVHNLKPIKITIPEGTSVLEMNDILSKKIPDFDTEGFLLSAKTHEGYLFPETYFIYSKTKPSDIVDEMMVMFDTKTKNILSSDSMGNHTKQEIVIMASIIEKEARGVGDRTIISSILWSRLAKGMRLQVDATVAYAVNKPNGPLKKADFSVASPFNTYLHKGLPPAPISNPGIDALTAAVKYSTTPYLYYLHDKNGTIHYAKTYAEHLANIKKFLR